MTNGNSTERERFEDWFKKPHGLPLTSTTARVMWEAWQARAALSVCADGGKGEAVAYQGKDREGNWHEFTKAMFDMAGGDSNPSVRKLYDAPQAECAPREAQNVMNIPLDAAAAMADYTPQAECAPPTRSLEVIQAVADLNSKLPPLAERAPREAQPDGYAFRCGGRLWVVTDPEVAMRWQSQGFEITPVASPTPERAQESAGVRLTPEQSGAIQIAVSILSPEYQLTANRLRSIVATDKEPQP
jgi:hypothetical protein